MSAKPQLRVVAPGEPVDRVEGRPLIPEGIYRAVYARHETALLRMFKSAPKLFVHFRIVETGEAFGLMLYRCYRVKALSSKPGRDGKFLVGDRHEIFLTLSRLTPEKLRRDRLSIRSILGGSILRISVRTVKTDSRGRALPPALHYSVVGDLLERETQAKP